MRRLLDLPLCKQSSGEAPTCDDFDAIYASVTPSVPEPGTLLLFGF